MKETLVIFCRNGLTLSYREEDGYYWDIYPNDRKSFTVMNWKTKETIFFNTESYTIVYR